MNVNSFAALEGLSSAVDKGEVSKRSGVASKRSRQRKPRHQRRKGSSSSSVTQVSVYSSLSVASTAQQPGGQADVVNSPSASAPDREDDSQQSKQWECQRCSYLNVNYRQRCSVCSNLYSACAPSEVAASRVAGSEATEKDTVNSCESSPAQLEPFVLVRRQSKLRRRFSCDGHVASGAGSATVPTSNASAPSLPSALPVNMSEKSDVVKRSSLALDASHQDHIIVQGEIPASVSSPSAELCDHRSEVSQGAASTAFSPQSASPSQSPSQGVLSFSASPTSATISALTPASVLSPSAASSSKAASTPVPVPSEAAIPSSPVVTNFAPSKPVVAVSGVTIVTTDSAPLSPSSPQSVAFFSSSSSCNVAASLSVPRSAPSTNIMLQPERPAACPAPSPSAHKRVLSVPSTTSLLSAAPFIPSSMSPSGQHHERPEHERYMYGFRTALCRAYIEKRCPNDAYVCFDCHAKPPRRCPRILPSGEYTYAPTRCRYMQTTHGKRRCPQGDVCRYAHSTEEMIYHPLVYKTQLCAHSVNSIGMCTGFGVHCAKAHGREDQRYPLFSHNPGESKHVSPAWLSGQVTAGFPASGAGMPALDNGLGMRREDAGFYMLFYKTDRCPHKSCPRTCERYHNMKERRRSPRFFYYSEQPCPYVKSSGATKNWRDPSRCPDGDRCRYAHTLLEQMYHPHIYKTSPCNNFTEADPTRCSWGLLCTHAHGIADMQRQARALAVLEPDLAQPSAGDSVAPDTRECSPSATAESPIRSPARGRRGRSPRSGHGPMSKSPRSSMRSMPETADRMASDESAARSASPAAPGAQPLITGFSPVRSRYALPSLNDISDQIWHPTPDEDQALLGRQSFRSAPSDDAIPSLEESLVAPSSSVTMPLAVPSTTPGNSYNLWTPMTSVSISPEWSSACHLSMSTSLCAGVAEVPGSSTVWTAPGARSLSPRAPSPSHRQSESSGRRSCSPAAAATTTLADEVLSSRLGLLDVENRRLHDMVSSWRQDCSQESLQVNACPSCMTGVTTLALDPCGHTLCRTCVDTLSALASDAAVCPVCARRFLSVHPIC